VTFNYLLDESFLNKLFTIKFKNKINIYNKNNTKKKKKKKKKKNNNI